MLESFLDPLGKPMQIHEITRRAINEAGIISNIADNAMSGLANKLLPGSAPDERFASDPVSGGLRQGAAGEINRSLLAPLAKEMRNRWAQTVQQLLLKSVDRATGAPVTSAAQLDRGVLEKELYTFLNTLAGVDLGTMPDLDDGSGQAKQLDSELKPQVTAAIANTQKPNPGADVWLPLATSIQRAKSIKQFSSNKSTAANNQVATVTFDPGNNPLYNGKPYNANDPSHKMALSLQQQLMKTSQP